MKERGSAFRFERIGGPAEALLRVARIDSLVLSGKITVITRLSPLVSRSPSVEILQLLNGLFNVARKCFFV